MDTSKTIARLFAPAAACLSSLFCVQAMAQTVAYDDFDRADYGNTQLSLQGLSGGTGWTSVWSGHNTYNFIPTQNYRYTGAIGYVNSGADETSGSIFRNVNLQGTIDRNFSTAPITEGYVWISFLSNRLSVNALTDWTGVQLSTDGGIIYFGTRQNRFVLGTNSGLEDLGSVSGNTGGNTHLIIARIDVANDTFSAWFNPADVSSLSALGSPHLSDSSRSFTSVTPTIQVWLRENTDNTRMNLDALRVSYGEDQAAGLRAVVNLEPDPGPMGTLFVERSVNLHQWEPVDLTTQKLSASGEIMVRTDEPRAFYRVRVVPDEE